MRSRHPKLSPNELAIMGALWDMRRATGKQVLDHLTHPPALTTLLTYLARLQAKGYVRRESSDSGYLYSPAVPRTSVGMRLVDQAVEQFDGKLSVLVSHFVKARKLSADERRSLRDVLDGL